MLACEPDILQSESAFEDVKMTSTLNTVACLSVCMSKHRSVRLYACFSPSLLSSHLFLPRSVHLNKRREKGEREERERKTRRKRDRYPQVSRSLHFDKRTQEERQTETYDSVFPFFFLDFSSSARPSLV